jgi:predicted RNA binding protein YcfA (HicA-like mRNA interferase family)
MAGSHRQFKHADKPGRVAVSGKPSDALAPGTLNSILIHPSEIAMFYALRRRDRES